MDKPSVSDPGKRTLLKTSAFVTGAGLLAPAGLQSKTVRPPTTQPFMEALPVRKPKLPLPGLNPAPTATPGPREAGRAAHQGWAHWPPQRFYELRANEFLHSFHPHLPRQKIWGFDGMSPGPTLVMRHGQPALVRIFNELPPDSVGFGSPEISTHMHNAHTPSESDGFPADYFSPYKHGPGLTRAGDYKDHHYVNCHSNYAEFDLSDGDPSEGLGTLWYHDHRLDFTAANVYKGLAGFCLMFDEIDSGNENDANPKALRLPSGVGEYDITLMFEHKHFNASGYLTFNQFDPEGDEFGNKYLVNGKVQPFFEVERRKYRFRMLNASILRFFEFYLVKGGQDLTFDYIANDGNLLPAPLKMNKVAIAPAERGDIVVDFSQFAIGDELFIVDRINQDDGRGPNAIRNVPGVQVLRFNVVRDTPADRPDLSRVPDALRPLVQPDLKKVRRKRHFKFEREDGVWVINGKLFDENKASVTMELGEAEIWTLEGKGSWHHPIHIHLEEARILKRNGRLPPPHERGRKDVIVLNPGEEVQVYLRFTDFPGKYVMHCHNLIHEDHHMMLRFDVEA